MSELSSALIKDLTFRVPWYLSPPVLLLLYTHRVNVQTQKSGKPYVTHVAILSLSRESPYPHHI